MTRSGRTVEVNLANGSIFVDSKKVDLQLDEFPADFRWINFNRVYAGYGVDGSKSESVICVVGWQGNLKNGSNVKRMVLMLREWLPCILMAGLSYGKRMKKF